MPPEFRAKVGERQPRFRSQLVQSQPLVVTRVEGLLGRKQRIRDGRPPGPGAAGFLNQVFQGIAKDHPVGFKRSRQFLVDIEQILIGVRRVGEDDRLPARNPGGSQGFANILAVTMNPGVAPAKERISIEVGRASIPEDDRPRRIQNLGIFAKAHRVMKDHEQVVPGALRPLHIAWRHHFPDADAPDAEPWSAEQRFR